MNAFLEVLTQLVAAISSTTWKEMRFLPYQQSGFLEGKVFDACIFSQNASGALGILWIEFQGQADLLIFPFRLARYQEDGDIISLSPWSLRDASADVEFFDAWRKEISAKSSLLTAKGAQFKGRNCGGKSGIFALGIHSDIKGTVVRIEETQAVKIFKTCSRENSYSAEVEILEYLNKQSVFLNFAGLISVFEYISPNSPISAVAISFTYLRNDGSIWHDFLAKVHLSRFLQRDKEKVSSDACEEVLRTAESLGRLVGEFHCAMAHCRENINLIPETNSGEGKLNWLRDIDSIIKDRINVIKNVVRIYPHFGDPLSLLEEIKNKLFEKVWAIENLGLKIRIHGRLHLGHILNTQHGLYLFDFDCDESDDSKLLQQKHSSLKDLASLCLSLKYAWYVTNHKNFSPVIEEFIGDPFDKESEVKNSDISSLDSNNISFLEIESTVLKAYKSAIFEDVSGAALIPPEAESFKDLLNLMCFSRMLRESARDFTIGNPRLKTSIKILTDFCQSIGEK